MHLPKSAAHWSDVVFITLTLVCAYVFLREGSLSNTHFALTITIAVSACVSLIEIIRAPWWKTVPPAAPLKGLLKDAGITWLGSMACLGLVLFGWWLLAEYKRSYYKPLFDMLPLVLPYAPVVILVAIVLARWRLGAAENGAFEVGRFLLCGKNIDIIKIRDELLGLLVKGFFFPINFVELAGAIAKIRGNEHLVFGDDWLRGHGLVLDIIYALIIGAIIPGYFFGSRLFGNEVKKVDHTVGGWLVTLCCYAPLVVPFFTRWFNYRPVTPDPVWAKPWTDILGGTEHLLLVVAGAIILFELLHYWAEAHFGIRSSNLTHRGIITDGPYRYCKHPVYLVKCIGWALIWMPFAAGSDALECLRLTLLFLIICLIYLLRGYVEERLLSSDPDYVAYGLWMDKNSLCAFAGRLISPLSFRWRYARWQGKRARGAMDF